MTATMTRKTPATIANALLREFEQELNTTRRFIERVPKDKLGWKPHDKSMTAGELALHIAGVPVNVLNMALPDRNEAPDFRDGRPQPKSVSEILDVLDAAAVEVRRILPTIDDERMQTTFEVTRKGTVVLSIPRAGFLRMIMLNHWIHHRGQLGVYLRLLGAAVPSSYGPSGDENPFA